MGFYHLCYLGVASEAAVGGVGWWNFRTTFSTFTDLVFFFGGGGGEVAVVENTWEKLFFFLGD